MRYRLALNLVNLRHFCNNKECVFLYRCVMKISDRQPKISDSLKFPTSLTAWGAAPPSTPKNTHMMYREHIGWTSSKLITGIVSLWYSLLGATTSSIWSKGNTIKFGWNRGGVALLRKPVRNISETHMRCRLLQKSTTLDDLKGPLRSVLQN